VHDKEIDWIARFVRHLETERRLAALTVKHYLRDIESLRRYCDKHELQKWADLDNEHLRAYSAAAYRRGLSSRSIQRRLSANRTFFRYLVREKWVKKNPVDSVSAPKSGKRLPGNLDADRMARLLDIKGDSALVSRDRAILELLYSSGLRLGELLGLNIGDIDIADATVRVTGKGNKERIVPVGRHALKAIVDWQQLRGQMAAPEETALFVSQRGTRLSPRSVQARVDYWAKRQGIDCKVYPHIFRHSFASHLLESSHDLRGVQELLGHANISTTQIYTHLDFQYLAQIYDQTHPRAKIKNKS
jgi:integrase/recombinase XerC